VAVKNVAVNALDNALPATSFTAIATLNVYVPLSASDEEGVNVALLPEQATVPATALPLVVSVMLLLVAVEQLTTSEKFTDTVVPVETPDMPLAGVALTTVGGVVSGTALGVCVTGAGELSPPPHAASPHAIATAITPLTAAFITKPLCKIDPYAHRRKA
jgi:hypothetical protein